MRGRAVAESWDSLVPFILGEICGILTADVSDWLFFKRVGEGTPLSPIESVWYWYYLPALFMVCLLAVALFLMRLRVGSAKMLAGIMVGVALFGAVKSAMTLGGGYVVFALLIIPVVFLATSLFMVKRWK